MIGASLNDAILTIFVYFPQAMADAVEKQRQMTRQRLEEKRRKREEQQYEEDMAASIVTMAEKRNALIREKTMLRREGHKDAVSVELLWIRAKSQMKKCIFHV